MASLGFCHPATSASGLPPQSGRQAWQGCVHNAVRPKTHWHPMARLGTIKTNTISNWGFSMSSQAPAWKRVVNCVCVIAHTWNHMIAGQKSSDPHVALVDFSHRPASVERSKKSLMLSLSVMEEKEPVSYKVVVSKCLGEMLAVMPGCLPPATLVVCLWKVPRCRLSCEEWFNLNLCLCSWNGMAEIESLPRGTLMSKE